MATNGCSALPRHEGLAATVSQQFAPDVERAFVPYVPPPMIALRPGHYAELAGDEDDIIDSIMDRHIGALRRLAVR